ncbi:probable cysteine--tRNA ligase, mitochondrial [Gigantopelta aegis]|uniref:probable cysteine--tRNA ligase, mitochondrial n=1 Tax=Gigantopelta aegis TaxID=1735272 RepID=UPI001B88880C|nr:probable cysteine--tRNA ligase, mitochondrial [Gigantopelta aegis]
MSVNHIFQNLKCFSCTTSVASLKHVKFKSTVSRTHFRTFTNTPHWNQHNPKQLSEKWTQPTGFDTGISVWNSLTKTKCPLILQHQHTATWYLCGPTVYDSAHLGHGSTYMRFDILRRILTDVFDIDITLAMSLTNIDDKIINRANELGLPFTYLAWNNEIEFFDDMATLNILPPTVVMKVTEHVPQIIDFIRKLEFKEFAYSVPSGSVFFDVSKYSNYGELSSQALQPEAVESDDSEKRNPRDFALWKAAKPGEPHWPAPWGNGRPGWHIECSTMASTLFHDKMDIHSGGEDLLFPHHENELAQSQAYHGCTQWANYWLHSGHLYLKGDTDKMSKSLKNVITISDFLQSYTADQFRLFCLLTHYKSRIEYSEESMHKAISLDKQIINCLSHCDSYIRGQLLCQPLNEIKLRTKLESTRENVDKALRDDFNTPLAMEAIMDLIKQVNIKLGRKTETSLGGRNPAIVSQCSAYLKRVLRQFGMLLRPEVVPECTQDQRFTYVVDSAVKFRSKVRSFAVDAPTNISVSTDTSKTVTAPLLEACDEFRDEMKTFSVQILDHGKNSTWTQAHDPKE